ncbi:MAG: thioredoxin family protein, partial [Pseudomonadota bacterium]
MRTLLAILFTVLTFGASASAESVVKVINFTADWCPNCQILNPRLNEAIEAFPAGSVERVDLDVTRIRRNSSVIERGLVETELLQRAD